MCTSSNKTNKSNQIERKVLREKILKDSTQRKTISFYRYVRIEEPDILRDELYARWNSQHVLGRIYIAKEGINAQMAVPEKIYDQFIDHLYSDEKFRDMEIKEALEENKPSFIKLTIKVRENIVADGLGSDFRVNRIGNHLNAEEFNQAIKDGAVVVDMRNHYESEVGHFENALLPESDTFRETLPKSLEMLKGKQDAKVLLYCTGGIRCEKASAFLLQKGFKDVNQLKGGIIEYAHQVKEKDLDCKFKGKNFVFDDRMGERVTEDVLSTCHQCGESCDRHVNCANDDCHLLFIQCSKCEEEMQGCWTKECIEMNALPRDEQKKLRKGKVKDDPLMVYRSHQKVDLLGKHRAH